MNEKSQASTGKRPPFLTLMAILFAVMAVSNASKVLQVSESNPVGGFVFLGVRFRETLPLLLVSLPFAAMLAAYARGLWLQKRWVARIAVPYAFYVPANLTLFWFFQPADNLPSIAFIASYIFFAVGGSVGTALYLMRHYEELRD